jgi:hypothetical protein
MKVDTRYANKLISTVYSTILIGTYVDSTLSWATHIELTIHKLGTACYAVRSVKPFMSQKTVRMVNYSYLYSTVNHRIIFWRNPPYSVKVCKHKQM